MNHPARQRRFTNLSESTERKLESYGLAATAAGVGVLALASAAEAKIVYTSAHHLLKPGTHYNLDLNHDGTTDFTLRNGAGTSKSYGGLSVIPAARNGAVGFKTVQGSALASALQAGTLISGRYFPGRAMADITTTTAGGVYYGGSWVNVNNRYLGLRFKIQGKYHFGWARLNVQVANLSITATLTGYAYETIPNKAIIAGKTKGPDVITVQPGSPGRLALGRK
jgi:hypothetical protein